MDRWEKEDRKEARFHVACFVALGLITGGPMAILKIFGEEAREKGVPEESKCQNPKSNQQFQNMSDILFRHTAF